MKLINTIIVVMCTLSFDKIHANSNIDELKSNSKNFILDIKREFLSIKNKIISPYNKKQFPCELFLDSLKFLSEKLDDQRKNMFSGLIGLDLRNEDIHFFDNLNRDSILLYNIINGFRGIYHRNLSCGKSNRDYSFEQYTQDMRKLLVLEKSFF